MALLKTFFRRDDVRRALCWLGAQYIRLVHFTGSWTAVRGEIPRDTYARQPEKLLAELAPTRKT